MKPAFLITIDTEGDNAWARSPGVTTENARWLPRFQSICERYGVVPSYLTNYEMAACADFRAFARDAADRGAAEIGMHLHAWNSPPFRPLTPNDSARHPFLIEYPEDAIFEKVRALTRILEDTFGRKVASHRAGRWAFNGVYARALLENGYLVDCSVTPGRRWESGSGTGNPNAIADYTHCSSEPYFVDLEDIRRAGSSALLEVPLTVRGTWPRWIERLRRIPGVGRAIDRFFVPVSALRPGRRNRARLLALLRQAAGRGDACVEFMLHSSELMPGGSPTFPDAESIETLYRDLDALFALAAARFDPCTLTEFARRMTPAKPRPEPA